MHEITPKTDAERRGLSQFPMSMWPLLELCRPLGSNDGAMGSSFGPLSLRTLPGASFWVWVSEVGGNFCLRAASNSRSGQGATLIDILCLMDSRSFVGRFPVSPKHWPGPVAHLRVSLSSSSRKFFKMCHEIVHVKIRILYSIPPNNSLGGSTVLAEIWHFPFETTGKEAGCSEAQLWPTDICDM